MIRYLKVIILNTIFTYFIILKSLLTLLYYYFIFITRILHTLSLLISRIFITYLL